jgi:YegS C-terminal NAD kinase beta sandwich-like domain
VTIRKGQPWGEPMPLAADGRFVRSDAEARALIEPLWLAGGPLPPLGLLGGDLCRTLGGRGDEERLWSADAMTFPVDLGIAEFDGERHCFVAHVVARRSWWRGRAVAAMNAQWLGEWDLGPRSHPDDGLLDITDGVLPPGQRLEARRRARTGTHLPHPDLRTSRVAEVDLTFERPLDVWLDGERVGRTSRLRLDLAPDALRVVI